DSAVVSVEFASDHGLGMGMLFDLHGPLGSQRLLVTGISDDASNPPGDVVMNRDTFRDLSDDSLATHFVVFADDGADPEQVREGLRDVTADHPTVVVSDVQEFVETQ